jgi:hypothetical protein
MMIIFLIIIMNNIPQQTRNPAIQGKGRGR